MDGSSRWCGAAVWCKQNWGKAAHVRCTIEDPRLMWGAIETKDRVKDY